MRKAMPCRQETREHACGSPLAAVRTLQCQRLSFHSLDFTAFRSLRSAERRRPTGVFRRLEAHPAPSVLVGASAIQSFLPFRPVRAVGISDSIALKTCEAASGWLARSSQARAGQASAVATSRIFSGNWTTSAGDRHQKRPVQTAICLDVSKETRRNCATDSQLYSRC